MAAAYNNILYIQTYIIMTRWILCLSMMVYVWVYVWVYKRHLGTMWLYIYTNCPYIAPGTRMVAPCYHGNKKP